MQVEFRSHFSGEKSASNGPGNTVPSKFCRNFLNIDLEMAFPKVPPSHIYNVIHETENNFDLN